MPRAALCFVFALVLLGCAGKATKGLLEADAPLATLAKEGDLGFTRFDFPARAVTLPSGLRVAYETAPSRGMVAVILALDVGSTADPAGREGLAHYAEHLVFRNRRRGAELGLELSRLGATFNATTSLDATIFHMLGPAPALPALLELAAGLLDKPLAGVDPGEAAVELDVVRSELMLRNETGVYGQLRTWMQSLLVDEAHPYRRSPAGSFESLQRITLADARAFADAHYKPARATLLVVGDVAGEGVKGLLEQRLPAAVRGDPAHPVAREKRPVPLLNVMVPAEPAAPVRHQAAVALPELWLGYLLPGKFSQNVGGTRLIASRATELRLHEVFTQDPDVLTVRVVPLHDRLATILAVQVVLASDKRRDAIADQLRTAMATLWRPVHPRFAEVLARSVAATPVRVGGRYALIRPTAEYFVQAKAEQLQRLRFKAIADSVNELEPWMSRALERAEYLQVLGEPGALLGAVQQATKMDQDSANDYAAQFLGRERARLAYLDPLPVGSQPRTGRVGVADRPITDDPSAAIDFGEPFIAPAPPELRSARTVRLDNGLTVVVVRRPGFPAVTSVLGFAGGAAAGDPAGVVDIVRWLESRAGMSLPLNAVEATPIEGPSFTGDLVRAGARNLPNALYLLAQRLVDTDKTDWSEVFDGNRDSSAPAVFRVTAEQRADHLLRQGLYGEHPLGRAPAGPELLDIRGEDMERWLLRMRNPSNAFLAIVGEVDPAEGERLARVWFGSWSAPKVAPATLPPVPAPRPAGVERPPIVVNRDGDAQARLALACRLPAVDARARATYQVLGSLIGGYLNTMLRHRAGAAYAVDSRLSLRGGGAADLLLTVEVETKRLPEALTAARALWSRLGKNGGIDAGAVSQARWAVSSWYNLRYGTASELALSLLETWSLGWPVESLAQYPERLRATTPADLQAAFRTCRESTVSLVLGQQSAVDPLLAAAR